MSQLWQHPFVNVFKHFNVASWKKSTKEGEVVSTMDRTLKCTVYRITGSIPAGNYIQLPKTSSQSLGLTGRYLYIFFKPVPTKYFVVHVDVTTLDGLVVRISFSNLFKEFKSTSTWLQFPYVCHSSKGSIHGCASSGARDNSGPTPMSSRWTMLCLDFSYILSMYLNRKYSYMKSIRLCANMFVKNIITSDVEYEPGMTLDEVKKSGMNLRGVMPLPREVSFPLGKGEYWHDYYDLIRFPSDGNKKPFDSIQHSKHEPPQTKSGAPGIICPREPSPKRISPKTVDVSKAVSDRVSLINKITSPKKTPRRKDRQVVSELPSIGLDDGNISVMKDDRGEVHVFARPEEQVVISRRERSDKTRSISAKHDPPMILPKKKPSYQSLLPDPILQLQRIVGFGGATFREALWTKNGKAVLYPCHAVIVSMDTKTGYQRFFIGHTDKISCLTFNGSMSLLASGQTGTQSVVRIWDFKSRECLAMFKTHVHSVHCLSFSNSGTVLCGVGKDGHGKNMVVIWNTSKAERRGEVNVMAKAHTDVDIVRMKIADFDDTRMVSCGRDNVRVWRVRDGALRSAPVNLGEYHTMEFTDVCFEAGYEATKEPSDRLLYACSRSGHIFEINYKKMAIQHVRRLLPAVKKKNREKITFNSGAGIALNTMSISESFCVTGSDDGYLRLWPLDFAQVYLEAEHEGPVTAVSISTDGLKILAGTVTGNLGILDVATRNYTTIMRSHTDHIHSAAVDPLRRHIATVSKDHTIRVWDIDNQQQLFDFTAPQECPCAICYHPTQQVFACGFESGSVRIFNVGTTSMLAEYQQHRGRVTGLAYSPNGEFLYSSGSLGILALYDASTDKYALLRVLGNTVAHGDQFAPDALTVSPDGNSVAFVGPSEFTISVVNARSLDEILRVDISTINPSDGGGVDTARRVCFAPANMRHLLVTTSNNKLLKLDARSGRLLAEINNVQRVDCTALAVTSDGKHLATAGDRVIKIWDYHMRLDLNFQVFIGHSGPISSLIFTPDSLSLITIGEAIFMWDFLANLHEKRLVPEGRVTIKNDFEETGGGMNTSPYRSILSNVPRERAPLPQEPDTLPDIDELSTINQVTNGDIETASEASEEPDLIISKVSSSRSVNDDTGEDTVVTYKDDSTPVTSPRAHSATPTKLRAPSLKMQRGDDQVEHAQPQGMKHFIRRQKMADMAQRRYTAPPNQAGLKLKSVIGYNGNGRGNMVWQPDTGFFAYSSGCIVVVEDLNKGTQRHLLGHVEEVSCMAVQHDCQLLASASGAQGLTNSQICVWDLENMVCKKVLSHHEYDVVCLDYARDDRFLVSAGDYRECSVVVWSTYTYTILTATKATLPIHSIKWDPYTMNEFASVGENGAVLFWLLDEGAGPDSATLNVHEADVPEEILKTRTFGVLATFTCLEYAGDNILYIGSSEGKVSAWDTRQNTCFMHWEADKEELEYISCHSGRMITASAANNLRIWTVTGICEMKLPGGSGSQAVRKGGLTMEDEMNLDGAITSMAFDETLDLGIVGTTAGTLWYINWAERTSIRLISGHKHKVNGIAMSEENYFATCADDGSLRLWFLEGREQTIQFQVQDQACNCLAFAPPRDDTTILSQHISETLATVHKTSTQLTLPSIVAGYSDGTVRVFDVNRVEMMLKMHPHAVAVTAISFSTDGRMILSGASDGLIAVSSTTTGMTVRVINDHKGAPITNIDTVYMGNEEFSIPGAQLWLATSVDRRVSVWSVDWSKDSCELIDWLTFSAPAFAPDGSVVDKSALSYYQSLPPSIAKFSHEDSDIIVYIGYGMQRQVQFYSMGQRKVVRTAPLTHWSTAMDLSPRSGLVALGTKERLLKLMDYYEGSFQDFIGHSDGLDLVKFSPDGRYLFTGSHAEILLWEVVI
ncbi:WD repeat-containing protein 90-like [Lineus longissimus]|uniref:WD repeat-containing protein 90-like n=1 Tax=Lineus longissimus TaxID=88925 RepID=UPI00315D52CF